MFIIPYICFSSIHLIRTYSNTFFYTWVIFHCVCVPQLSYPSICWWTSRLFPCLSYCKQCCNEHWGTCVFQFWFPWCVFPAVGLLGHMQAYGEGNSNTLQYSCLENPMTEESGRLQSMGSQSWTWLSHFTFAFHFQAFEDMAIHSSVLAWRIPGTGEPGGLPSMGSHRIGHDWSDLAAAACKFYSRFCKESPHCSP